MEQLELKAREILSSAITPKSVAPATIIGIETAFKALWYASATAEYAISVANAIARGEYNKADFQRGLTALVKQKVLRSQTIRGVRHYEVNFK